MEEAQWANFKAGWATKLKRLETDIKASEQKVDKAKEDLAHRNALVVVPGILTQEQIDLEKHIAKDRLQLVREERPPLKTRVDALPRQAIQVYLTADQKVDGETFNNEQKGLISALATQVRDEEESRPGSDA